MTSQTDALDRVTRYEFDVMGRRTARVLPMLQRETFAHALTGELSRRVDFAGRATTHAHDEETGRLASTDLPRVPGTTNLAYEYYGDGTRRSVADGSGTAQYLERDERGRVTRIERPGLPALLHEFDDSGNRTLSRVEGGPATTYAWDGAGRMTAVVDGADGARADYVWDAAGRLETVTYSGCTGPEIVGTYAYQPLSGGLESITWETVETTPRVLLHLAYELDDGLEGPGRRTGVVETWSGGRVRTVGYQFDELYRLTGEDCVEFGSSGQRHIAYTYDDVGNRTRRQVWGNFGSEDIASVHDDNDRLLHAGVVSYAWDPNGNLVSRGGMPLDWDDLDRMTDAGGFAFEYDPDGLKRRTDGPSGDVRHVVDASFPHAQVIEDRSAAGALAMRYVRGIHPVKLVDAASGKSWWYLHDAIGSTRALVSCAGATPGEVTDEWDYEAFGEVTQHRAFGATGDAAGERNRWLFAGEERRAELGLDYLRARWMEPGAGRFVSRDAYEGNARLAITRQGYVYGNASPTVFVDPSGRMGLAQQAAADAINWELTLAFNAMLLYSAWEGYQEIRDIALERELEILQAQAINYECEKFVEDASRAIKKHRRNKDYRRITFRYTALGNRMLAPGIQATVGVRSGETVGWGTHSGVLRTGAVRRGVLLAELVLDNNPPPVPLAEWIGGAYIVGYFTRNLSLTFVEAEAANLGTIKVEPLR